MIVTIPNPDLHPYCFIWYIITTVPKTNFVHGKFLRKYLLEQNRCYYNYGVAIICFFNWLHFQWYCLTFTFYIYSIFFSVFPHLSYVIRNFAYYDKTIIIIGIALCCYPHVKMEIGNLIQITTTAPIFQQSFYFRQKYLEITKITKNKIYKKNQLHFKHFADRIWIKL